MYILYHDIRFFLIRKHFYYYRTQKFLDDFYKKNVVIVRNVNYTLIFQYPNYSVYDGNIQKLHFPLELLLSLLL